MVKIREDPIKMDDLGGPPLFLETPISTTIEVMDPTFFRRGLKKTCNYCVFAGFFHKNLFFCLKTFGEVRQTPWGVKSFSSRKSHAETYL